MQLTSATVPIFGLEDDGIWAGPPGWSFSPLGPDPHCAIATDPHKYGPAGINYTIFKANGGVMNIANGGMPQTVVGVISQQVGRTMVDEAGGLGGTPRALRSRTTRS